MKVLIVEDEKVAYAHVADILAQINPSIEIAGHTESVSQTIYWLETNPLPDLILMDIHLSDGSAFSIFESITVETPIIFTTTYDKYAIEAFKVNSVDYLLKPVKAEALQRALVKLGKWTRTEVVQYLSNLIQLAPQPRYKDKLLIPVKDKLLPIDLKDIACFYSTGRNTYIYLKDGTRYAYSKILEQIVPSLNPSDFTRANKQFIIARDTVKNITIWFDSRLLVSLTIDVPENIYVSKNKSSEFKHWLTRE